MKKIAQINIVCTGSTGNIMCDIQNEAEANGYETISFYGRGKQGKSLNSVRIGSNLSFVLHVGLTFITNRQGHFNSKQTKKLLAELEKFQPDIIHLHNIHGYYLNYNILFDWLINSFKGKIIWTLHDCWSFTGHCAYFTYAQCDKWKTGCSKCPQKHKYPFSWFFDTSSSEYLLKKKLFTNEKLDITITTVSSWLKEQVDASFLNKYPIIVKSNWIDLTLFKPTINNNIYSKYKLSSNKKIILGVANIWEKRKGLNTFVNIYDEIKNEYSIIIVGLSKRQIKKLPKGIIGIERTEDIHELIELYSTADVFLNPSVEETFSLVTLEALACNTPAIVVGTSAVKELICNESGIVINDNLPDLVLQALKKISLIDTSNNQVRNTIIKYDKRIKINELISLYEHEEDKL